MPYVDFNLFLHALIISAQSFDYGLSLPRQRKRNLSLIPMRKQSRRLFLSLTVKIYEKIIGVIALPIHLVVTCQLQVHLGLVNLRNVGDYSNV